MLVELNEEELDFLQRICTRARLKLFSGQKYVTHKLDFDPDKLDKLRNKLQGRQERHLGDKFKEQYETGFVKME